MHGHFPPRRPPSEISQNLTKPSYIVNVVTRVCVCVCVISHNSALQPLYTANVVTKELLRIPLPFGSVTSASPNR